VNDEIRVTNVEGIPERMRGGQRERSRSINHEWTRNFARKTRFGVRRLDAAFFPRFGEYTNARMIIDLGERHEKKPEAPKPKP